MRVERFLDAHIAGAGFEPATSGLFEPDEWAIARRCSLAEGSGQPTAVVKPTTTKIRPPTPKAFLKPLTPREASSHAQTVSDT